MYVNTAAKKEDNDTVAQFMASDTDNVKKNVQSAVVYAFEQPHSSAGF
jgi:hypothetical protein